MRNPDRIPIILNKLDKIWKHFPDLRFGQLCVVLYRSEDVIFAMEDDRFEERLDDFIKKHVDKRI